jgi:phosphosulfolactate synthase
VACVAAILGFNYERGASTIGDMRFGPDFLALPPRSSKPRISGLTHVLDKGVPPQEVRALVARAGDAIDLWKLGWGTAYLDPDVTDKVAVLGGHAIRACVGGTLLEVAWAQGRAEACLAWAAEVGFPCVEVSNGSVRMPLAEKRRLIEEAAARFLVLSEVGSKDPDAPVIPEAWTEESTGDLAAGATLVLTEGRESGTVGLYRRDGSVREDVADALVEAIGLSRLVFEAPRKEQQAWLINRYGNDVNLGNVPLTEVIGLEALRLGLRADTFGTASRLGSGAEVEG